MTRTDTIVTSGAFEEILVGTYYFDIKDGVPVRDRTGLTLPSGGAAIEHSKRMATRMREEQEPGKRDAQIVVIDPNGTEIHRELVYPEAD